MKLISIVSVFAIALVALALITQVSFADTNVSADTSKILKIIIAADGSNCATKGGILITNKDGSNTCTMPMICKPVTTKGCADVVTKSDGPVPGSRCCCSGCQNSPLPHCDWCSP